MIAWESSSFYIFLSLPAHLEIWKCTLFSFILMLVSKSQVKAGKDKKKKIIKKEEEIRHRKTQLAKRSASFVFLCLFGRSRSVPWPRPAIKNMHRKRPAGVSLGFSTR